MKNLFLLLTCSFFAMMLISFDNFTDSKDYTQKKYLPAEGFVPDEKTAIKIAEAILVPIYGETVLEKKPFIVKLEGDIWSIKGTLPEGYLGGVPYIKIRKSDCQILMVGHSK